MNSKSFQQLKRTDLQTIFTIQNKNQINKILDLLKIQKTPDIPFILDPRSIRFNYFKITQSPENFLIHHNFDFNDGFTYNNKIVYFENSNSSNYDLIDEISSKIEHAEQWLLRNLYINFDYSQIYLNILENNINVNDLFHKLLIISRGLFLKHQNTKKFEKWTTLAQIIVGYFEINLIQYLNIDNNSKLAKNTTQIEKITVFNPKIKFQILKNTLIQLIQHDLKLIQNTTFIRDCHVLKLVPLLEGQCEIVLRRRPLPLMFIDTFYETFLHMQERTYAEEMAKVAEEELLLLDSGTKKQKKKKKKKKQRKRNKAPQFESSPIHNDNNSSSAVKENDDDDDDDSVNLELLVRHKNSNTISASAASMVEGTTATSHSLANEDTNYTGGIHMVHDHKYKVITTFQMEKKEQDEFITVVNSSSAASDKQRNPTSSSTPSLSNNNNIPAVQNIPASSSSTLSLSNDKNKKNNDYYQHHPGPIVPPTASINLEEVVLDGPDDINQDVIIHSLDGLDDMNQDTIRHANKSSGLFSFMQSKDSDVLDVASIGVSLNLSGAFEGWSGVKSGLSRQKSLLAELFSDVMDDDMDADEENDSTAASLASSDGSGGVMVADDEDVGSNSESVRVSRSNDSISDEGSRSGFEPENVEIVLNETLQEKNPNLIDRTESPLLVSLADIGEMRRRPSFSEAIKKLRAGGRLPLQKTLSHDNLSTLSKPEKSDDYHHKLSRLAGALVSSIKGDYLKHDSGEVLDNISHESCSTSTSMCSGDNEIANCQDVKSDLSSIHDESTHDNICNGKSTDKLYSYSEKLQMITEERDAYRDMCLTLGAQLSSLMNVLSLQQQGISNQGVVGSNEFMTPLISSNQNFHAHLHQNLGSQSIASFRVARTVGPMSVNLGDQESERSEDDITDLNRISQSSVCSVSRKLGVQSETDSHNHSNHAQSLIRSRLSKDIFNFMEETSLKIKNMKSTRRLALERLERAVRSIWPRAQIIMYGSHATSLALPSSDVDVVICLPAVHQDDPALAAGVLEGRNAINETKPRILGRKLKGESWLDPRSIKVIEKTAVPVIKVSTKDRRERVLQLDISFDSQQHHGIQALEMIKGVLKDNPMIRPICLILKQFLSDRGLLESYTGGISSYCLFVMVSRFLQERPSFWVDCGALLLGFLDFYGNSFDPRSVGISLLRGYFQRPANPEHHIANIDTSYQQIPLSVDSNSREKRSQSLSLPMTRRHSFTSKAESDKSAQDGDVTNNLQHHRFPSSVRSSVSSVNSFTNLDIPQQSPRRKSQANVSFKFDPLFVEDPLLSNNNVGRNAFRVFQVKRAFADAHRALFASLEWDLQSNNDMQYPLLNCLLQNEDRVFDADL